MRGASAESQASLLDLLDEAVTAGVDGDRVADDLFGVAALLRAEPSLRRILTDLSMPADAKAKLVRQIFGARLDSASVDLLSAAVGRRWAATRDLADALEHLGVVAVVKAADRASEGDALEDQLFSFGQLVSGNPGLRDTLSDPARSADDKRALLRALLQGKVTSGAIRLAEQAASGSHRTVAVAMDSYQKVAADQRNRLVALVRVASPLGEAESERLATALSRQYDRPVHLNQVVDESVIGGVRVEVGDDVIDGTVASRLDNARRRLAG